MDPRHSAELDVWTKRARTQTLAGGHPMFASPFTHITPGTEIFFAADTTVGDGVAVDVIVDGEVSTTLYMQAPDFLAMTAALMAATAELVSQEVARAMAEEADEAPRWVPEDGEWWAEEAEEDRYDFGGADYRLEDWWDDGFYDQGDQDAL
jgi:hypothetical protein